MDRFAALTLSRVIQDLSLLHVDSLMGLSSCSVKPNCSIMAYGVLWFLDKALNQHLLRCKAIS